MTTIRVLHIQLGGVVGGIESQLIQWTHNINTEHFAFDFVTYWPKAVFEQELIESNHRIYHIKRNSKRPLTYYKTLLRILKNNNYNIVHIHKNSLADNFAYLACRVTKIKGIVMHSHNTKPKAGGILALIAHKLNREVVKRSSCTKVACSEEAGKWMFGKKAIAFQEVFFLPNAINVATYSFSEKKRKQLREKLLLGNQLVIGCVGHMIPQKNHLFLIDVFYELLKLKSDSVLLLIGDGDLKNAITSKIQEYGIQDHVLMLGQVVDSSSYYSVMDICCMPSHFEGFPVVALESQAADLPLLVSNSVTTEICILESTTFLPIDDPLQWARALLKINTKKPRLERRRELSARNFDIACSIKMLENLYFEIDHRDRHTEGSV
jgi:glycosyltransferase involved in cell wall biosynthesis